jgi:hypothetical protein
MLGIGPERIYLKQNEKAANSIAGEIAGRLYILAKRQTPVWLVL